MTGDDLKMTAGTGDDWAVMVGHMKGAVHMW